MRVVSQVSNIRAESAIVVCTSPNRRSRLLICGAEKDP